MRYALICEWQTSDKKKTYQTEMFGDGALGVHFYNKIVPLMEPSNWSRVYSSPTNKVISAHFTRNNCLLVGHLKQYL